jgi:hypothetical protein
MPFALELSMAEGVDTTMEPSKALGAQAFLDAGDAYAGLQHLRTAQHPRTAARQRPPNADPPRVGRLSLSFEGMERPTQETHPL